MTSEFIKNKAREISYALVRVVFYIKRTELRNRIESLSFELLDNSAKVGIENTNQTVISALSTITSLDVLVRFAHSIYEIEPVNATILVRELDNLNSAIRQFGKLDEQLPDLESLFSKMPISNQVSAPVSFGNNTDASPVSNDSSLDAYRAPLDEKVSLADLSSPTAETKSNRDNQSANIAVRQSAIMEKIKSSNGLTGSPQVGCRLKDLLSAFPDVSERTIRYDLQKLCDGGIIERVGNGGPATYYRIVIRS